jgi:hypothetical protein
MAATINALGAIGQAAGQDPHAGFTLQPPLNLRLDGIVDSEVLHQHGSWPRRFANALPLAPSTIWPILVCSSAALHIGHRSAVP